jgi:hypothetical protein
MLEALGVGLAYAVHHRDRGLHPGLVRELHDLQPPVGASLFPSHDIAHPLHQDLAATARDRVQTRALELPDDILGIHPEHRRKEINFARAESVNVNGMIGLNVLEQVEIPLERDVRIVPALDQNLHAAHGLRLVDLLADLLERKRVPLVVFRPPIERAETAVGDADVRVVDVPVDDERDHVIRMLLSPDPIGFGTKLDERGALVEIQEVAHQAAGRNASRPSGT